MTADEWNRAHAIGTRVHVRGLKGAADVDTVTTTVAWHTSRGTAVVGVKARRGGVALADVTVLREPSGVACLVAIAADMGTIGGCRP